MADTASAQHTHRERLAHDERRGEILSAVRAICAEDGAGELSVSAITKRVGCTRSLFYHYFPTKEAALEAVLDDAIERVIRRLRTWNESRTLGDIEGALDSIVPLLRSFVLDSRDIPVSLVTGGDSAIYTSFIHRIADRVATYICSSTVVDFARHHEVHIDHVYETFYMLITGIVMFIRTHPEISDETLKDMIASTLHIEGYTEKYRDRRPER